MILMFFFIFFLNKARCIWARTRIVTIRIEKKWVLMVTIKEWLHTHTHTQPHKLSHGFLATFKLLCTWDLCIH